MKIAIAGASGFVGRHLIRKLETIEEAEIIALSRSEKSAEKSNTKIKWVKTDLYSLLDLEYALNGCDYAFYLVHSMLPSARLSQGNFSDFDLILADNFVRAARSSKVKQIIYLSGLIPEREDLSGHLKSRLEVERVLGQYKEVRLTTLRAGMILGKDGSSFNIMLRLVKKLPFMICPHWTQRPSQPIDIDDTTKALVFCLNEKNCFGKSFDLGTPEKLSYIEMMRITSDYLKLKRLFLGSPFLSPALSRLWVSMITGAPRSLVAPLIKSLKNTMIVDEEKRLMIPGTKFKSFRESVAKHISEMNQTKGESYNFSTSSSTEKDVRSVQRLPLPEGKDAKWAARRYMEWLPNFFSPFIKVRVDGEYCYFNFIFIKKPLLILKLSEERSSDDRQLFYIIGGLLSKIEGRGRLEFRETFDKRYLISAIHDFRPSLPWFIYKFSQAPVHLLVMKGFSRYLKLKNKKILSEK